MASKRNSQASRNGDRRQTPAWAMVLLGVVIGVGVSAAVLLSDKIPTLRGGKNLPQPNPDAVAPKEPEKAIADDAAKATPPASPAQAKNGYDFYTVLAEKEIAIPDAELSAQARAEQQRKQQAAAQTNNAATTTPPPPTSASPSGGKFMLQVTATNDAKAADEMKARLAMMGFTAKVYSNMPDGKIRVRLGPYASASETEAAKKALAANNIPSFGVKDSN
jgi:cell division protein FtsN